MYVEDVIKNMEDVWGMKKGYEKNPVAVKKFIEVAHKLRAARISELTPDNREEFEKITGEYITDRVSKSGTKFGWSNRESKDPNSTVVTSDYKMDIDEEGNLIEEGKEINNFKGVQTTTTTKNEYNKHGLGMKSEKTHRTWNIDRKSTDERKTVITRNSDLVTAKVETIRHSNKDSWLRKDEDVITSEVKLNTPFDSIRICGNTKDYINRETLEVRDDKDLHRHMEKVRDEGACDYSLESFNGKYVSNGKPSLSDYDKLVKVDNTHTPEFTMTYNKDEAFRNTAKDSGLRPDLEKRVKTNKLKEIYDKVKDKLKGVADKFTRKTKDDKTQDMKY